IRAVWSGRLDIPPLHLDCRDIKDEMRPVQICGGAAFSFLRKSEQGGEEVSTAGERIDR
ncbi:hypothetical protein AVEN_19916-1, partial [Araneus ventricosus]